MSAPQQLVVGFNGRHVAVECGTEWLAVEAQKRLMHLVTTPGGSPSVILRVIFEELELSWIEVRDSTGRCERGSFDYVAYHARKWMTAAFVAAHPDLIWLHASAASVDGAAVLLAGPAGAGKSTLLVHLVNRNWDLLADDAVAVRPPLGDALPLPFSPEMRVASCDEFDQNGAGFLGQSKTLATIPSTRVASKPAAVRAIVFPEYARDESRPIITPLSVVSAAQALATQVVGGRQSGRKVTELFHLARAIPAYRLRYGDSAAAAGELARLGRLHGRSKSTEVRHHRRAVSSSPDARSTASTNVNPRRRAKPES